MILMRTLRKDYARYSKEDEMDDMERDLGDEYGWKQVHGDVFRPAASPLLFSALIGTGSQLAVVVLFVVLFAILGELYTERGDTNTNGCYQGAQYAFTFRIPPVHCYLCVCCYCPCEWLLWW